MLARPPGFKLTHYQTGTGMSSSVNYVFGFLLLAVGLWLVVSGRFKDALVGVLCLVVGAFFVVIELVDIVWRFG